MKNENGKKGLFTRLAKNKKTKKSSSCCNLEIEELPEKNNDNKNEQEVSKKEKGNSCCK